MSIVNDLLKKKQSKNLYEIFVEKKSLMKFTLIVAALFWKLFFRLPIAKRDIS